jgi:hypothetical protein
MGIMTTLLGSFLAAVLVAQAQDGDLQGKVVDDQGKPVADALVVLFTPEPWIGVGESAELRTKTDGQGRFQLTPSRRQRAAYSRLWAYRPGWAVAAISGSSPRFELVLHKAQPRTVKVEGPDAPRALDARSLSKLVELLAWYDREAAAAVFETERVVREQTGESVLASSLPEFLNWVLCDPRAAVAEIEQLRATNDREDRVILAIRRSVGTSLGRPFEDRWRLVWRWYGYGQMKNPLDRDVW